MPASARGLAAGAAAVPVLGGAVKAAVMSDGKDSPDDCNGNKEKDGGNNDNAGDNKDWGINLPDTAAAATNEDDDNNDDDEGMLRKNLVIATIWRKTDATDADIPEGGASNGPTTKLRQYSSLTVKALAPLFLRLLNLGMSPKDAAD